MGMMSSSHRRNRCRLRRLAKRCCQADPHLGKAAGALVEHILLVERSEFLWSQKHRSDLRDTANR
jgi:hypothetical protein